jgi:hypothetical protein
MCDLDDFLAQTHPRLITELSLVGRNETLLAVVGPGVSGGKIDHETNKERIASGRKGRGPGRG